MAGAAKIKDPESYEPWPLDIRLLELMPDEGLIGGVHYTGRTVKGMTKEINDAAQQVVVRTSQLQARCRILRELGFAQNFPATGGRIWARTVKGKKYLAARELAQKPAEEPEPEVEPDAGSAAVLPIDIDKINADLRYQRRHSHSVDNAKEEDQHGN